MGRFVPLVLGALSTLHIFGAIAQDIPPCIPGCADTQRGNFAKLGCASAVDATCLCAKPDFAFAIRDSCASCGATDANVHQFLAGAFCANFLTAASTSVAASSSALQSVTSSTALSVTSSTAQPSATQATVTTSTPSSTSAAPTTTQQSSSTTQQPSSTTSSASLSTAAVPTSTSSASQTSATPSTTSGVPASATSSQAATGGNSSTGLPQAAVIGIGVGIGAAVIAIAGIAIGLLLRKRKPKPRQPISKPLSASDRMYPSHDRDHSSFEKYGNDIEMVSNRYEDMVPRTQPRTMV